MKGTLTRRIWRFDFEDPNKPDGPYSVRVVTGPGVDEGTALQRYRAASGSHLKLYAAYLDFEGEIVV